MEKLLQCKLCGGNVSSSATQCPHCGTCNFIPDSYLTEMEFIRQAAIQKQNMELKSLYRQQGYLTQVFSKEKRALFPNEASIDILMNHVSPKNVYTRNYNCNGFLVYFDGKLTDNKWINDREDGCQYGGDVIVPLVPIRLP